MKKVLIDGVFDLFHYGHIELFKKIKESNDYIIVAGIISDKDVESYKRVPILKMEERAFMVESCKYVDEVIINCPDTTKCIQIYTSSKIKNIHININI